MKQGQSLRALLVASVLLAGRVVIAQPSGPEPNLDPNHQPHAAAGIDSVDPYTGQLAVRIPLGPVYTVSPSLSFQLNMHYSSRVWEYGKWVLDAGTYKPHLLLLGDRAVGLGWRLCLGQIVESSPGVPKAYIDQAGAAHQLYNSRVHGGATQSGTYYSRDGSFLRVAYLTSPERYELATPDGNVTTFDHEVAGLDNPPDAYTGDFGRGRNGWYVSAISTPYDDDAITVTYQIAAPWILDEVRIKSFETGGSTLTRTINVTVNGTAPLVYITEISFPMTGTSAGIYSFSYSSNPSLVRPISIPSTNVAGGTFKYLDSITLPAVSGQAWSGGQARYAFTYEESVPSPRTAYSAGAMSSMQLPTMVGSGAGSISYTYGTWAFYHANKQTRPFTCLTAPNYAGKPIIRTFASGMTDTQPNLVSYPVGDCDNPARTAGIIKRSVNNSGVISDTEYHHLALPRGETDGATGSESMTLVVSPPDGSSSSPKQTTTTYLYTSSETNNYSGPRVGALKRVAIFAGDVITGSTYSSGNSCPNEDFCASSNPGALRVQKFTYEVDAYDTTSTEPVEANRRANLISTLYHRDGISDKVRTVAYSVYDGEVGRYTKETQSGTFGGEIKVTTTTWAPPTSLLWRLDRMNTMDVRVQGAAAPFLTVTNSFNAEGDLKQSDATDGSDYAPSGQDVLKRFLVRDLTGSHGFVKQEYSQWGTTTAPYTLALNGYKSGTLKTSNWVGLTPAWNVADNVIDANTGLVTRSKDPSFGLDSALYTDFEYDEWGRLKRTSFESGKGQAETTTAQPTSPLVTLTEVKKVSAEFAWQETTTDELGQVVKIRTKRPGGAIVKKVFEYDRRGNRKFESEWYPDSATILDKGTEVETFDYFGRPQTIIKADGKRTLIDYSDGSYANSVWKKSVTVEDVRTTTSGTDKDVTTEFTYDSFGRLVTLKEPAVSGASGNETSTYTYDVLDRLVQVDSFGISARQTRKFQYDAFGFLRNVLTPEQANGSTTAFTVYTYDPLGNVLTSTEPSQFAVTRTYDEAARLVTVSQGAREFLRNCWDGVVISPCQAAGNGGTRKWGRLTQAVATNDTGSTPPRVVESYFYDDPMGRVSRKTTSFLNLPLGSQDPGVLTERWFYDPAGQVVSYQHPRRALAVSGDPAKTMFEVSQVLSFGSPVSVSANGVPIVSSATYHPSGLLASYVLGTGVNANVTMTIAADPHRMARPASFATSGLTSGTNFASSSYLYDGPGNIHTIGGDKFAYDELQRLKSAELGGQSPQTYSYSASGSLTAVSGPNPQTYTINTHNRLSSGTYDAKGNLTAFGGVTYAFDDLNRLRSTTAAGSTYTYHFNPASERTVKIPPSGSGYLFTLRDPSARLATDLRWMSSDVYQVKDYIYLGGLLVATHSKDDCGGTYVKDCSYRFMFSDHLGSPRLVSGLRGDAIETIKYFPYGEPIGTATERRTRFAGMEYDVEEQGGAAKRYYGHARTYEHGSIGRFLSLDPLHGSPADSQSWNRYSYARGNPVSLIDPTGMSPEEPDGVLSVSVDDIKVDSQVFYRVDGEPRRLGVAITVTAQMPTKEETLEQLDYDFNHPPQGWLSKAFEKPARAFADPVGALKGGVENRDTTEVFYGIVGLAIQSRGGGRPARFNGPKPKYSENFEHVPGMGLKPGKTPLPPDAQEVYLRAVPENAVDPKHWYGRNASGQLYRFSSSNDGFAHFNAIEGVGDGIRTPTRYAIRRLDGK